MGQHIPPNEQGNATRCASGAANEEREHPGGRTWHLFMGHGRAQLPSSHHLRPRVRPAPGSFLPDALLQTRGLAPKYRHQAAAVRAVEVAEIAGAHSRISVRPRGGGGEHSMSRRQAGWRKRECLMVEGSENGRTRWIYRATPLSGGTDEGGACVSRREDSRDKDPEHLEARGR